MALTAEEKQELDRLEKELGGDSSYVSVLSPSYQAPSLGQQFKQAAIEELPGLGGMLGGVIGAFGGRSPAAARTGGMLGQAAVRGTVGAGFGGAIGEAGKQAILGTPDFLKVVTSGVEQATYDSLGNLVFSAGGRLFNVGRDKLMGYFGSNVPTDPNIAATLAADRLLKESGGFGLTPFQSTGETMSGISESLARSSFTGKPVIAAAEKATDKAIQTAKTKILDNITTGVYDSVATGESFATAINAGDEALKNTVRPFYENLSQTTGATVNLIPIQNQANQLLNRAEKAGGLTLTDSERAFLTKISSAPESIDFGTAHDILSSFKTIQRDAKSGTSPDTALYGRISSFVDGLQNQMDSSFKKIKATGLGSQLGGVQTVSPSPLSFEGRIAEDSSKTLAEQYKFYSNLYREGIEDLYSETTSKLLKKDPEFVGKNIFASGNVTAFNDMKKALGRAKQLDKTLDVQGTIDSVRRGYVENLLKSEGSLAGLGQKIDSDETIRRTFKTVLTEDQQNNVKRLLKAAELSSVRPTADAPLFLAAQQAQAIGTLGVGALLIFNPDAQKVAADNPGWSALAAGTVLLGPRFIAKSITNPKATNAALALIKQQESGSITGPLLLKSIQAFEQAGITAEDLLESESTTTNKAPVGLNAAEQEELRKLEQELGQ
jgi:hypothetical protein